MAKGRQDATLDLTMGATNAPLAGTAIDLVPQTPLEHIAALLADINTELDSRAVLRHIVGACTGIVGADAACVLVAHPTGLTVAAAEGLADGLVGVSLPLASAANLDTLERGEWVRVDDIDAWAEAPEHIGLAAGNRTMLVAPITARNRFTGGLLVFFAEPSHALADLERQILRILAAQAGTAISHALAFEEALQHRAHVQAIIDSLADGVAVLDGDGLVSTLNAQAEVMLDTSADAMRGSPLPLASGPAEQPVEHQLSPELFIEAVHIPLPDSKEAVVTFRNVSNQKAVEAAKLTFMASTSHELKTPLTVITTFSRLLRDRHGGANDDPDRRLVGLSAIADAADELSDLVEKILMSARAEASRVHVHLEPLDLRRSLMNAIMGFDAMDDAHRLELDIADDLPLVWADAEAMKTTIGLLLENAVKYSPDGGTVTLSAHPFDDKVTISVSDEGIGLGPEDLVGLFQPFFQGSRRREAGVKGGVGLGLSIAHRLVTAQGGTITAAGEVGEGACFRITLPCDAGTE